MKKQFLILIISILTFSCFGQINESKRTESKRILDSIIITAKIHSIYRNDVNWPKLEERVYAKFNDSDSINSVINPIQYLLGELGDYHGFLVINGKQYWTNTKKTRSVNYDYNSIKHKEKQDRIVSMLIENKEVKTKVILDSIAYVEIPFFLNNQGIDSINNNYVMKLRKAICDLSKINPKGYIIDLRRNLGGTVYPMISGIGELLQNLELGGTTIDNKNYEEKWELKNGNFFFGENSLSNIPEIECQISTENTPIVILIGRYTASSGEVVASALKGQKNIKLIGEQTAGYTTTNSWFSIYNNVSLNPSVSFYMSKDKTVHKDGVFPDIEVNESLNVDNMFSGKVMNKAIEWISTGYNKVYKK